MHWLAGNMRHDPWCRERNVQHARRMQQARWKKTYAAGRMEDAARKSHGVRAANGTCNARAARLHAGHWVGRRSGARRAPASSSSRCRSSACILPADCVSTPITVALEPASNDHDYAHERALPISDGTEWRGIGRTGVCRDGTLRQTRPLRDEQKHPGGRKHWFVRSLPC